MKTNDRDVITWAGLAVVGAAAAIMSFTALSELARMSGIRSLLFGMVPVAWLLPITIDVMAGVATRVWLQRRLSAEAVSFARWAAWAAIGATVVGNAAHGALVQASMPPPWWAVVIVSAVPAIALGALVHLAVLASRPVTAQPPDDRPTSSIDVEAAALYAAAQAERAAAGGAEAEPGGLPDRRAEVDVMSNTQIIDDLRAMAGRTGRQYSRDEVKEMYGIGSERAKRLLLTIGWFPRAVPGGGQAEASAR